jgi:hypothetical protein
MSPSSSSLHRRPSPTLGLLLAAAAATVAAACVELDEPSDDLGLAEAALVYPTPVTWDSVTPGVYPVQLEMIANADGRLAWFSRDAGGSISFSQQTTPGGSWTTPIGFADYNGGDFDVEREGDGRLAVFRTNPFTGVVSTRSQVTAGAGSFGEWLALPGAIPGLFSLEAAHHADGRLAVFAIGTDRAVWTQTQLTPGGAWGGWTSLAGAVGIKPNLSATSQGGRIAVVVRTKFGAFYVRDQATANGPLGGWTYVGKYSAGDFATTRLTDGRLQLAWVPPGGDADRALRVRTQSASASLSWNPPQIVHPGPLTAVSFSERPGAAPMLAAVTTCLAIPCTVADGRPLLWQAAADGTYPDVYDLSKPVGTGLADVAIAFNLDGRIEAFGTSSGAWLLRAWQTAAGLPGTWH